MERVQKAATNLVPQLRKFSYPVTLKKISITSLKDSRLRSDMIELYKLFMGKEQIDYELFFRLAENHYRIRGREKKLTKDRSRLDTRKFFFSQRVVNRWNSLPTEVVNAESVNSLKMPTMPTCHQDMEDRSWSACQAINIQVQVQVSITAAAAWKVREMCVSSKDFTRRQSMRLRRDRDAQKTSRDCLETETTSLVLSIDVLMKFLYFFILRYYPKTTSDYSFNTLCRLLLKATILTSCETFCLKPETRSRLHYAPSSNVHRGSSERYQF